MSDLAATAERLRLVKKTCQHFLTLWALDHAAVRLNQAPVGENEIEQAVADPMNRDWSLLYRGSVLDD